MNVLSSRAAFGAFCLGIMVGTVLTQCTPSRSGELVLEETAFQALHLVDMQQTLSLRHHPCEPVVWNPDGTWYQNCYREEGSGIFAAGWLIGHRPKDSAVYGYFAGEAVAHAAISYLLRDHRWASRTWEAFTIGIQGEVVKHNFSLGLQVRF